MSAEVNLTKPQRLIAKNQIVRVSRSNFLSKVIPYIHGTNTDVFDPESIAIAKHQGTDSNNSTITTSHRLTPRLLDVSTLPEWLELPGNYPDILNALAQAFLGDSEISAFDNPSVMIGKFAEACKDPEVIKDWEFRIGWGGHPDVSPRLPAYLVPMLDAAKRFQEQGLPVPKITVFNGVNAASFCNYDHETNATELLNAARETNHKLITAFVHRFAPGIEVNFEDDDIWTDDYLAKTDEVVERLMGLAEHNPPLRRVLYELCVAGSQHQNGVIDPIKNSLRYVVKHLDYFSEVTREGEEPNPNHAVFNWINGKEMEFGYVRKELRNTLPPERIGPRACDIRMDNISSQQTPYYPQTGIDAPLGKWEDVYRGNHHPSAGGGNNGDFSLSSYWQIMKAFLIEKREQVGKKTFRDYVRDFAKRHSQDERLLDDVGENVPANLLNQNQQIGALYDWVAIGRKINPQNPKAGLEIYLKFLEEFEKSADGREFQRKREELQAQLPKHTDEKDDKKPPPPPPQSTSRGGSGGMPQTPTPRAGGSGGGATAMPSGGGGDDRSGQSTNAVGIGRVDNGQEKTTDSTNRITWQDYMGFPSSPHDPSPPWVSGTMDDFIANIATPEVLGEWFTSLNNPQIPHKNKAMIASFVDRALSLQSRGKLNIPTSLMKAMQNALDNHAATIRPQNTFPNGVRVNSGQLSQESLAHFTKQTMDGWIKEMQNQTGILANMAQLATDEGIGAVKKAWATEMQQLPGQIETAKELGKNAIEQIQQTAEYANEMWQSLPPEARTWIEKEGLKTVVWTAAASLVLSPLGALAAGPIMTASTDLIVEAVKKGSELLAHHPEIPRDDVVAAVGGAVATVGVIPFLGPFAPLVGAGAGVMAKRAIQHGGPPAMRATAGAVIGIATHGPGIALNTAVAASLLTKAAITPAAQLLKEHPSLKAHIAAHGIPALALGMISPPLALLSLAMTGTFEGMYKGTQALGSVSAKDLNTEGSIAVNTALDDYRGAVESGGSQDIAEAAKALKNVAKGFGEWISDVDLMNEVQAEASYADTRVSEAQARESREAWANLFGGIANALSGLGKMDPQPETYNNTNYSQDDVSMTAPPLSQSYMPDPEPDLPTLSHQEEVIRPGTKVSESKPKHQHPETIPPEHYGAPIDEYTGDQNPLPASHGPNGAINAKPMLDKRSPQEVVTPTSSKTQTSNRSQHPTKSPNIYTPLPLTIPQTISISIASSQQPAVSQLPASNMNTSSPSATPVHQPTSTSSTSWFEGVMKNLDDEANEIESEKRRQASAENAPVTHDIYKTVGDKAAVHLAQYIGLPSETSPDDIRTELATRLDADPMSARALLNIVAKELKGDGVSDPQLRQQLGGAHETLGTIHRETIKENNE